MKSEAIRAILTLAGSFAEDDLTKYEQLPPSIKDAMLRKIKEREIKAADDAAEEILKLSDYAETLKNNLVEQIRKMRKSIEFNKTRLIRVDDALKFGMQTNNFAPLLVALNIISPSDIFSLTRDDGVDAKIFEIPASFKPNKSTPVSQKSAKKKK